MPRVPIESLPDGGRVKETIKKVSNNIYKYAIFIILGVEVLSYFLVDSSKYLTYFYPLLTQLNCALLIYGFAVKGKFLKFCNRKIWAFKFLMYYYFFGFISILFRISNEIYTEYISYGLLIIAIFIAASTFYKK